MNEQPPAPVGLQSMSPAMGQMDAYKRYLFEKLRCCLGKRVLEIGVGHGTYTRWLLESADVLATDIDPDCLEIVRQQFATSRLQTARIDLDDLASIRACGEFGPDTVICINVLEHIERDCEALRGLHEIVVPGARLGLIVPAHPSLLGRMDREAGHYRRYTRRTLAELLAQSGWQTLSLKYINLLGAVGWWFHNRVRRDAGLSDPAANDQMRRADRLLPLVAALTDPVLHRWAGLSVVAIARRP
jgi:2-polyprenyl-3-methyl-5-hydroxy-6-metoxy-1,4-benzoquinol methylase